MKHRHDNEVMQAPRRPDCTICRQAPGAWIVGMGPADAHGMRPFAVACDSCARLGDPRLPIDGLTARILAGAIAAAIVQATEARQAAGFLANMLATVGGELGRAGTDPSAAAAVIDNTMANLGAAYPWLPSARRHAHPDESLWAPASTTKH